METSRRPPGCWDSREMRCATGSRKLGLMTTRKPDRSGWTVVGLHFLPLSPVEFGIVGTCRYVYWIDNNVCVIQRNFSYVDLLGSVVCGKILRDPFILRCLK